METDTVIGTVLIAGSMIIVVALVVWSRRTIHLVRDRGLKTAREILRGLEHE